MDVTSIKDPKFLKTKSIKELELLSQDIRDFLIDTISKTGGHLSSNLGVVELTLAMHVAFDSPFDQLIFDVGHQGYVHKILTGRAHQFDSLRKTDGLSGFLKRSESVHDVFEAGHASTSLAAGAGMLYAKKANQKIGYVVMLIGDGALASGMALETLNYLGHDASLHPIIIINDNEMSIAKNVGHLSKMLSKLRMKNSYRKIRSHTAKLLPRPLKKLTYKVEKRLKSFISGHSYFEDLGYEYYGPLDGHHFKSLLRAFDTAKQVAKPCIIHVRTQKGKGYIPSENDKTGLWHGVTPFEMETGNFFSKHQKNVISYSQAVADYLKARADKLPFFYVITPAMVQGSHLEEFQNLYPNRLIDVGIAEQTAITMATGMALKNIKPFVSIYSTFLQRAYDQLLHDLSRHNVDAIIGIDRAGIIGGDGDTHQGIYDIPMINHIPNLTLAHPKNFQELYGILNYAFDVHKGPIAIRYPKEDGVMLQNTEIEPISPSWEIVIQGKGVTLITFGTLVGELEEIIVKEQLDFTLINARYIKPLDEKIVKEIDVSQPIITIEESTLNGGLGSKIRDFMSDNDIHYTIFHRLGFDDEFVVHGDRQTLLKRYNLDAMSVINQAKKLSQ